MRSRKRARRILRPQDAAVGGLHEGILRWVVVVGRNTIPLMLAENIAKANFDEHHAWEGCAAVSSGELPHCEGGAVDVF